MIFFKKTRRAATCYTYHLFKKGVGHIFNTPQDGGQIEHIHNIEAAKENSKKIQNSH